MVKKTVLILMLSALALVGCEGERSEEVPVETIKPATAPPLASDEDSAVMTQTTEIGEERSPNEGGYVNPPGTTGTSTNTVAPRQQE